MLPPEPGYETPVMVETAPVCQIGLTIAVIIAKCGHVYSSDAESYSIFIIIGGAVDVPDVIPLLARRIGSIDGKISLSVAVKVTRLWNISILPPVKRRLL